MKNKRFNYIIILLLTVMVHIYSFGQSSDSLDHYLEVAVRNNPGVQSGFSLYQAALQKVPQAGAYQDLQLEMGFFLQPMELVTGKQIAEFKLMQMFPWFGTRKAARTEAQHMAEMVFEEFRETRDNLFLEVYTQWFTLCRLQRQLINNRENKKLLLQLEELALKKFSSPVNSSFSVNTPSEPVRQNISSANNKKNMSGMASMRGSTAVERQNSMSMNLQGNMSGMRNSSSGMSNVLLIQLEIAELDNNIESILSEIQAEKAAFNALLSRSPESEIQIPDILEQLSFLLDEDSVMSQITKQNPMLGMINAEESAYRAKAEMDKKMSYPMFGVGFQYMIINSTNSNMDTNMGSMNGKDMIMPMVSVSIPIFRNKYKAQQRENGFLQQASREKYANTLNMLEVELYRTKHQLDNAARKIALYQKQSELAQSTYELTVQEFISGVSDLSNAIQVQRQLLDYKLKTVESIADYNIMAANIQKLISSNNK